MLKFILIVLAVFLLKICLLNAGTYLERTKRVVGGSDAVTGDFPYQVSLRKRSDNSHFCSGSILLASVILTAAHCVYKKNPSALKVVAGSQKLSTGGTEHPLTNIIVHKKYNRTYFKRDIALVIIHPPIAFSNLTKPIELETAPINPGTSVVFSGWGITDQFETKPHDQLQVIHTQIISFAECKSTSLHGKALRKAKICTLSKSGKGACNYDSGGPLVAEGRQIGILSCGEPCAKNYPDIYTRVASFVRWIKIQVAAYANDND